jgi:hypothetical protein
VRLHGGPGDLVKPVRHNVTPKDMGTEGPIHLDGEDYIKKLVAGKKKEK